MLILQEKNNIGVPRTILAMMQFYFQQNRDTTTYARNFEENLYLTIIGQNGSDCAITIHVLFKNENWDCQLTEDDTVTMAQVVDCIESNYDLIQNMTIMFYDKD